MLEAWLRRVGILAGTAVALAAPLGALTAPASARARRPPSEVLSVGYSGHGKYDSTLTLESGGCTVTKTESSDFTWATSFKDLQMAPGGKTAPGPHFDVETKQTGVWTFALTVTASDISCTTTPGRFTCESSMIGTKIITVPAAARPELKASVFPATGKQPPILRLRIQAIASGYDFVAENPQGSPSFCPTLGNPVPLLAGLIGGASSAQIPNYLSVSLTVPVPDLRNLAVGAETSFHNIQSSAQPTSDQAPEKCTTPIAAYAASCTSKLGWGAFVQFTRDR